jgi:diguanylate cyclase (GGDEF)-like protein
MILEHEAIQQEMRRQARTDPLTGLMNRRAFMEEVERHVDRLDQERAPGTLMFVDMDAFKTVNDRLGHDMGDQTLMQVAQMLRDLVRPFDLIARFGGDEFAVWMSGADHLTAAERADHLRLNAPRELTELLGQEIPGLGLSIGIATRRAGSQEPIDDLIRRADMAMYEVKRGGRGHWRVSLLEGD